MHSVGSPCVRYTQLNHIQPHHDLGGAVAAQAEIPNGNYYGSSNGPLLRVFACSAGGPGFDFRLRRNIQMLYAEDVGGPGQAPTALCSPRLRKAETEFRELLHMVRKKDRLWRPCGDYRRLNLATTHDRYPLPSILDLSNKLHGCKFSSHA
jgi:hypothetical protein